MSLIESDLFPYDKADLDNVAKVVSYIMITSLVLDILSSISAIAYPFYKPLIIKIIPTNAFNILNILILSFFSISILIITSVLIITFFIFLIVIAISFKKLLCEKEKEIEIKKQQKKEEETTEQKNPTAPTSTFSEENKTSKEDELLTDFSPNSNNIFHLYGSLPDVFPKNSNDLLPENLLKKTPTAPNSAPHKNKNFYNNLSSLKREKFFP